MNINTHTVKGKR